MAGAVLNHLIRIKQVMKALEKCKKVLQNYRHYSFG